jgi:D-serine deaminase-like pyridoxal phosphate-dependent protein
LDELRPGNFVCYDVTQVQIGSCDFNQIAVVLACPIVSIHKERGEMIIYGGSVHLSKDSLKWQDKGVIYGLYELYEQNANLSLYLFSKDWN